MEPPETSERLTWAVCWAIAAVMGLSAESTRPLLRPLLAVVALGLAPIAGSWLWDHRGRLRRRQGGGHRDRDGR